MNRKPITPPWLRLLLSTASTSLMVCTLADPAAAISEIIPVEPDAPAPSRTAPDTDLQMPDAADGIDRAAEEEPVAEEPIAEEPVVEEPVAEEPALEEVAIEEPVVEEPVVEEPVQEIATDSIDEPVLSPTSADAIPAELKAIPSDSASAADVAEDAESAAHASESIESVSSVSTEAEAIDVAEQANASELSAEAIDPVVPLVAQRSSEPQPTNELDSQQASDLVGVPLVHVQGAYVLQGDESSARARLTGEYAFSPNVMVGTTIDLTTGDAFVDSESEGFNVNELYVAASPDRLPGLRFVVGMVDLTSYFDRNSFAKDGVTHFFNPVFQTNPALAATGIGSRPSALVTWQINDSIELKAATFSSSRNLDEFAFNGFAGELGVRFGNVIVRGTYSTNRDEGQNDGFREIYGLLRSDGGTGLDSGDREQAYGINAEWFIPELKLGLFGRYGHYENLELDRGGDTYSVGFNLLDLFLPDDRFGIAYGRQLSNNELRQDEDADVPDVLELFYDARLTRNLRAGVSVQQRDAFSETILGLRIRADFDLLGGQR